jgi:hypothetical protein
MLALLDYRQKAKGNREKSVNLDTIYHDPAYNKAKKRKVSE